MKYPIALIASMLLVGGLSARADADPIRVQPVAVTASGSWGGNVPGNAVDGNSATIWNSGGWATQWIQLDLGRTYAIRKIRLQVAQSPAGTTNHVILVGQDPDHLHPPITGFWSTTSDGQWL